MSSNNKSIIFYNGFREKSFCGYCKQDGASCSNGNDQTCIYLLKTHLITELNICITLWYIYTSLPHDNFNPSTLNKIELTFNL